MTTLKFMTVDQHLVLQRQPVVASGDKNSVLIQIQLCSMWDGFDVKVAFYKDGNRDFVLDVPLENGECMVPPEMLDTPCVLNIGIWGKDAMGRYKTSTLVKYRVHEGTPIEAGVTLIDVSDGTAAEDQVLAGATFFAGDTVMKTGNIDTFEDGETVATFVGPQGPPGVGAEVVQTTGDATDKVMSQNAVTVALGNYSEKGLVHAEFDAIYGNNLFAYATINGAINKDGSNRNSSSINTACCRTDYIPIYAGIVLTYAGFRIHDDYPCIAVYDLDKKLVKTVNGIGTTDSVGRSGKLTIEAGGYIRLCSMKSSSATATITRASDENAGAELSAAKTNVNRMMRTHAHSAFANMLAVAETYFHEAYQHKNLVYASQRGAMLANQTDENGANATNCSGFVNTILRGITFANSRYCNEHNKFADWGWLSDRSGRYEYNYDEHGEIYEYLTSYNLARYCADHGWLRKVNYTSYDSNGNFTIASGDRKKPDYLTNVHVGDIVFTGRGIMEEHGGTYLGINDAAIVVAVGHYQNSDGTASHTVHVMSAYDHTDIDGNRVGVDINRYSHENAEITYVATIPVTEAPFANNVLVATKNVRELTASNEKIFDMGVNSVFAPGFYTVSVHGDANNDSLSTYAPYLYVTYEGVSENQVINGCKANGWTDIVFYAEKPFTWELRCKKPASTSKYGVFDEVIMYKGAKPCLLTK